METEEQATLLSLGLNNAYGDYPTFINAVGNGVLYLVTTAHTWTTPIYKGALARAINATTGAEIWTLSSRQSSLLPAMLSRTVMQHGLTATTTKSTLLAKDPAKLPFRLHKLLSMKAAT